MSRRNPIDIVIPIYNAYDDLRKCIDSIKKYTDLSLDRVILINDCSTDERIKPYLESLSGENIVFIDNEKNAGFSNNVNKGMLYSEDRDVLLLNSDTIVTKNWVDKIVRCAYSMDIIGTVTPMSNSATLCSYPITCLDNEIPEHLTVDSLAAYVERGSMHRYPRITVAVGFCMFIKRKVIEKVGLFDAETFGRGYGEENDFCNRAEQYGYIHVMCDDTFIYHKGTVSFVSEEKQRLIDAHNNILEDRYPAQMKRNSEYCQKNPDKYIRDNIDIYANADMTKKNLMYVLHSDFRSDADDNMGGTQFHVRDLVSRLKEKYNVYVVARDLNYLRVTMYSGERMISLKYDIGDKAAYTIPRNPRMYNIFDNLLRAFNIDILHVHHTVGLGFDMIYAADALGIPVILTMHDYYYVCPNVKLVDADGRYCKGYCDTTACSDCLKKRSGVIIGQDYLDMWRGACRDMFKACREFIVPSEAARDVIAGYYPEIRDRITVIEHGTEISRDEIVINDADIVVTGAAKIMYDSIFEEKGAEYTAHGWAFLEGVPVKQVQTYIEISAENEKKVYECARILRIDVMNAMDAEEYAFTGYAMEAVDDVFFGRKIKVRVLLKYGNTYYTDGKVLERFIHAVEKGDRKYNVAFLGGMVEEKGSKIAIDMIRSNVDNINWHVFGVIGDDDMKRFEQQNLIKHGAYRKEELPRLMKQYDIDIICILPIWPETFCYTISEAVICGIPVFVTDIGAVGERVKRHGYGWCVSPDMAHGKMTEELVSILDNTKEYNARKQAAEDFREITLDEMSEQYAALYEKELKEHHRNREIFDDFDREKVFEGFETLEYGKLAAIPQMSSGAQKKRSLPYRVLRKLKGLIYEA